MSTASPRSQTDTCAYRDCQTEVAAPQAIEGSYCSEGCYYREVGARFLSHLDHRHELCGTCFRLRKDIERPPAEYLHRHFRTSGVGWSREGADGDWTVERFGQEVSRESVVGFADITEHASPGPFGLECRCGAIDHDIDDQDIRDTTAWEWWLQLASEYLRDIGAREDALQSWVIAHVYAKTQDLEYAVGFALDHPRD